MEFPNPSYWGKLIPDCGPQKIVDPHSAAVPKET